MTSYGTCKELLHSLYQELEPQISASYRPHVTYVPPPKPERNDRELERRKIKTASIVIGAVAELKKRKDASSRKKQDSERRESQTASRERGFAKGKTDVSQSWPNISQSDS